LSKLIGQNGKLPPTWTSDTGGDGNHFIYKHPGGNVPNKTGFQPGLDIRGDGGYIIVPSSLHKSGRRYAWNLVDHPDSIPLAEAPAWLLRLVTESAPHRSALPPEEWRRRFHEPLEEGERNTKITSLAGHLLRKNVDPYVTMELLTAFNDARGEPPLAEGDTEQKDDF
jgi:hypothetical protein